MTPRLTALTLLVAFLCVGTACATGPQGGGQIGNATDWVEVPRGIPVYQNFTSPVFYPSLTRRDIIGVGKGRQILEVEGRSSKTRLFAPIGYFLGLNPTSGISIDVMDRSVQKAIEDARERYGVGHLYDVRIDKHQFSILGIYTKTTTVIHAKGIR